MGGPCDLWTQTRARPWRAESACACTQQTMRPPVWPRAPTASCSQSWSFAPSHSPFASGDNGVGLGQKANHFSPCVLFPVPPASPEIVPRDNVLPSVSWLSPSSPKAWGAVARQGGTCAGLVARDPVWMSLRPPDSPAPAPRAAARLPPCVWDIPAGIPWCSVAASDATLGCQASSPLPSSPCPP